MRSTQAELMTGIFQPPPCDICSKPLDLATYRVWYLVKETKDALHGDWEEGESDRARGGSRTIDMATYESLSLKITLHHSHPSCVDQSSYSYPGPSSWPG